MQLYAGHYDSEMADTRRTFQLGKSPTAVIPNLARGAFLSFYNGTMTTNASGNPIRGLKQSFASSFLSMVGAVLRPDGWGQTKLAAPRPKASRRDA